MANVITPTQIAALGLAQLIYWGVSFYLIGVFGDRIADDMGWSRTLVHGGFSAALLVMGLVSPLVGRAIDQFGGRPVLIIGSVLCAVGCAWLATCYSVQSYYGAWVVLGVAMRCVLYDAAFAALARIAGPAARRPISFITLLGGLAATVFWPIGDFLAEIYGWRGALEIYAAISIATIFLHLGLPRGRYQDAAIAPDEVTADHTAMVVGNKTLLVVLYTSIIALGNALHAGMSAHLISVLAGLGLGGGVAVSVASLRGIGQSTARLIDVMFGQRVHPVSLNLIAAVAMPTCFVVGLLYGDQVIVAAVFTLAYGGATGILTITRGTLPLVLFDHRRYGAFVGALLVPSFLLSAVSPLAFAYVIDVFGTRAAMVVAVAVGGMILIASLALKSLEVRSKGQLSKARDTKQTK